MEEDHEEERGRDPMGGACEEERTGRRRPPMRVVVPHSHCSRPSVIFLLAADKAARRMDPAPRRDVNLVILSSK